MWLTLVALSVFTGFVTWIIEGQNEDGPNLVEALLFFVHSKITMLMHLELNFKYLIMEFFYYCILQSMTIQG